MWPAIVVAWGLQWLVFRFKLECWYCHFSSLGIEVRHIVSSQSWGLINNFTCSSGVKDTVCYFLGGLANLLRFQVSWKLCQTNDLCLYLHPQSSPHLAISQTPRTLKDTAKKHRHDDQWGPSQPPDFMTLPFTLIGAMDDTKHIAGDKMPIRAELAGWRALVTMSWWSTWKDFKVGSPLWVGPLPFTCISGSQPRELIGEL